MKKDKVQEIENSYIEKHKIDDETLVLKPEKVNKTMLKKLKDNHIKAIELVALCSNNYILKRYKSPNTYDQIKKASKLIRRNRFKLGLQMMIGMQDATRLDDLNTANALSIVYDVLKSDSNDATKFKLISDFDQVLGLDLTKKEEKNVDEEFINQKIEERNKAKANKDYAKADAIRDELKNMGILIKDTREGTIYEVI